MQYLFNRKIAQEGKFLDRRLEAYASYLQSLSSDNLDANIVARHQLLAYASDPVLEAVCEFDRNGGYVRTDGQKKAFVEIIRAVRRDAGGRARFSDQDIFQLAMFTKWENWDKA